MTDGVRYILAGFIDVTAETSSLAFSSTYNPVFDGYAFLMGFRTGDRIVALEICEASSVDVKVDGTINSIERKMMEIHEYVSDEDWVKAAQSCENLARNQPIKIIVNRWI